MCGGNLTQARCRTEAECSVRPVPYVIRNTLLDSIITVYAGKYILAVLLWSCDFKITVYLELQSTYYILCAATGSLTLIIKQNWFEM